MNSKLKYVLGLLFILLLPVGLVSADNLYGRTVEGNEVVEEEIVGLDDLVIEEGAIVNGDVNLWVGDADIAGTINGDLFIFAGNLELDDSVVINGDCIVMLGTVTSASAIQHDCHNFAGNIDGNSVAGSISNAASLNLGPDTSVEPVSFGGPLLGVIVRTFGLGLAAFGLASLAPKSLNRVSSVINGKPIASGTVGFLTIISALSVGVILGLISVLLTPIVIGLLGYPIILALGVLVGLAILVGWIAVGSLFGEMLATRFKMLTSLPATAALGTAAMTLGIGLLQLLPLGSLSATLVGFVIASIGLGAAALTKYGTKPYPRFNIDVGQETIIINDDLSN